VVVDPKQNVEYLIYLSERLGEFTQRFVEFLALHHENTGFGMARGIVPAVSRKDDADAADVARLTVELNRLAGNLMDLSNVTGVWIGVSGAGVLDPFAAWESITQPKPVLEASNVLGACRQASGRIDALLARANALAAPSLDPMVFHPIVWAPAQRLWNDGHVRQAVRAAAEAVTQHMKELTHRNDTSDTSLWQQAFSNKAPERGKPRLRWPGKTDDQDVKTMNDGLGQLAAGLQMTVRNPATHGSADIGEQEALERLAALSLLVRFVDSCDLQVADECTG